MKKALLLILGSFFLSIIFLSAQEKTGELSIGDKFNMTSSVNDYTYELSVFLPDNYEEEKDKQYPTLFLFLGGEHMFHAASGMSRLLSRHGEIPEMIVVGINNISWWKDLTPEKLEWKEEAGGGKDFLDFLSQQLLPHIDNSYRTTDHRIFMGHSLGGMYGIYMLSEAEQLFDDFVLISPSVQDRANSLFEKLEQTIAAEKDFKHDVYITIGGDEGRRITKGMHKLATVFTEHGRKQFNWKTISMDGHNHFSLMVPTIMEGLIYVCENDMLKEEND